ncbi:nicotinate phosphoribosyltransferase [Pleurotus eryngii]|uniref:Nicotinate phosphoribosyltransferase n=1 Tax=Pleurotus eryngii TaxID=5323 RepID=A0A9P5ZVC8_PLEER|nr:nicotinate phosphoribosyltransferase [Pleurotus eryngii]
MSASFPSLAVPQSILDTDLYKLTMQQAIFHLGFGHNATNKFTNRNLAMFFTRQCFERFRAAVSQFSDIRLTESEAQWLQEACPYFTPAYITYLSKYRFKPEQVRITFTPTSTEGLQGAIDIDITGPWVETILWEVPLMACLSETYFQMVDTDWNLEGQAELAYSKAKSLIEAGCVFSDFGTRRRRSFEIHDLVVQNLVRAANELQGPHPGRLTGSSNLLLAQKYGIDPVGTIAHEWFMGVAALKGYADANSVALDLWEEVYPEALQIALTDTFSTQAFFKSFGANPERANKWTGLRQDSGDPFAFAPVAKEVYNQLGIDTSQKVIVYSDSLNVERCIQLQKQCADIGFKPEYLNAEIKLASFGIGTNLTNDFRAASTGEKSKALNMVIKLSSVDDKPCVKISDDLTKNTGDPATVAYVKELFDLSMKV